jgi:hypothetical protein
MFKKAIFMMVVCAFALSVFGAHPVSAASPDNQVYATAYSVQNYVSCMVATLPQARKLSSTAKNGLTRSLTDAINFIYHLKLPALPGARAGLVMSTTITILTRTFGYYSISYRIAIQTCLRYL